jgi:hypothetical protein
VAQESVYRVARATEPAVPDCRWDKPAVKAASVLALESFMGGRPSPMPTVQAKLVWRQDNLSVIFKVLDYHVRCVATTLNGPVCADSCVEFFFTPGPDLEEGYFNIECNCGGTVLFMHQSERGKDRVPVSPADAAALHVSHTMPEVVEPELPGPVAWSVEYTVPYEVLTRYAPVAVPAAGARWRGNFHKCADGTSHPHWLTWAPIPLPRPDFHRKEYFGTLLFT